MARGADQRVLFVHPFLDLYLQLIVVLLEFGVFIFVEERDHLSIRQLTDFHELIVIPIVEAASVEVRVRECDTGLHWIISAESEVC